MVRQSLPNGKRVRASLEFEMSTVQSTVFDLDTMDRVTLVKQLPEPPKINSTAEALHFLGNDAKKLLEIIQKGIEVEQREQVKNDPNVPWMVEEESEDGKSTELSPFSGTPANEDKVNGLILSF